MRGAGLGTAFGQERPTVKRVSSRSTHSLSRVLAAAKRRQGRRLEALVMPHSSTSPNDSTYWMPFAEMVM